ncbi:MAG: hydroxypyruvate isomerase [Gammaproteobacteria bacterium]|nr:hydroxypyruvate isomerase [Gammaproteobacteria bacterium]NIM72973.1 hydroxypyruvate isomerase [Gammaproteobacteria bacterium]NIN38589.1 hydroxypyruvate isomerase [Gammaproteobacteria bacterium]NIO24725.1 hydroxypyruvate isomerase [Gammaproteobacteria bacterium]NIO65328.1 hydroxypyruvate isomerase [Gammaproteobacteria bacterium]
MPRLAANLNYLFTEVDLMDRFEAAAKIGFRGVEYQFPYAYDKRELGARLREHELEMVLMNLPAGDMQAGDVGIACDPERTGEFRECVLEGIDFAKALDCPQLNCLAGIAPSGIAAERLFETFVDNLRFAARRFAEAGLRLLIEPLNTRDRPGFYLSRSAQAMAIIEAVGDDNLFLQFDVYHTQVMEGDIVRNFERYRHRIAHVQIADNPGRHEPGTGELNFPFILNAFDDAGYAGWVSCEYAPSTTTEASLAWAQGYLRRS